MHAHVFSNTYHILNLRDVKVSQGRPREKARRWPRSGIEGGLGNRLLAYHCRSTYNANAVTTTVIDKGAQSKKSVMID